MPRSHSDMKHQHLGSLLCVLFFCLKAASLCLIVSSDTWLKLMRLKLKTEDRGDGRQQEQMCFKWFKEETGTDVAKKKKIALRASCLHGFSERKGKCSISKKGSPYLWLLWYLSVEAVWMRDREKEMIKAQTTKRGVARSPWRTARGPSERRSFPWRCCCSGRTPPARSARRRARPTRSTENSGPAAPWNAGRGPRNCEINRRRDLKSFLMVKVLLISRFDYVQWREISLLHFFSER